LQGCIDTNHYLGQALLIGTVIHMKEDI